MWDCPYRYTQINTVQILNTPPIKYSIMQWIETKSKLKNQHCAILQRLISQRSFSSLQEQSLSSNIFEWRRLNEVGHLLPWRFRPLALLLKAPGATASRRSSCPLALSRRWALQLLAVALVPHGALPYGAGPLDALPYGAGLHSSSFPIHNTITYYNTRADKGNVSTGEKPYCSPPWWEP